MELCDVSGGSECLCMQCLYLLIYHQGFKAITQAPNKLWMCEVGSCGSADAQLQYD